MPESAKRSAKRGVPSRRVMLPPLAITLRESGRRMQRPAGRGAGAFFPVSRDKPHLLWHQASLRAMLSGSCWPRDVFPRTPAAQDRCVSHQASTRLVRGTLPCWTRSRTPLFVTVPSACRTAGRREGRTGRVTRRRIHKMLDDEAYVESDHRGRELIRRNRRLDSGFLVDLAEPASDQRPVPAPECRRQLPKLVISRRLRQAFEPQAEQPVALVLPLHLAHALDSPAQPLAWSARLLLGLLRNLRHSGCRPASWSSSTKSSSLLSKFE